MRVSLLSSLLLMPFSLVPLAAQPDSDFAAAAFADDWPEEELIVRSTSSSLPSLPSRPPFTLHDYDLENVGHKWITPLDEEATFLNHVRQAYETASERHAPITTETVLVLVPDVPDEYMPDDGDIGSGTESARRLNGVRSKYATVEKSGRGPLPVSGLLDMVKCVVNPDNQYLYPDEEMKVDDAVNNMKSEEGLLSDPDMPLLLNFLDKGSPLKSMKRLFIELREGRRTGNMFASDGRRRLNTPEDRHKHGLWEHEIEVDHVMEVPIGWTRKMLATPPVKA